MPFLMIDGSGNPNQSEAFGEAVQTLYSVAYAIKFMLKRGPAEVDYVVMPLEALWWMPDDRLFDIQSDDVRWTAMIRQPDEITAEMVAEACKSVRKKKGALALDRVRLELFAEGRAAQVVHIGPYSEEGPSIAKIASFMAENGLEPGGKHHEVYLSDPNRVAPEKLKTVLRQPCRPASVPGGLA